MINIHGYHDLCDIPAHICYIFNISLEQIDGNPIIGYSSVQLIRHYFGLVRARLAPTLHRACVIIIAVRRLIARTHGRGIFAPKRISQFLKDTAVVHTCITCNCTRESTFNVLPAPTIDNPIALCVVRLCLRFDTQSITLSGPRVFVDLHIKHKRL